MIEDHIARLESEIRYLKGLLDKNGIPYDYETFVETIKRESPVEIDFPTLTAKHAIDYADEWPQSSFPTMPYIAPPKVGRNDPCPCGSGKKYKNCCGRGN